MTRPLLTLPAWQRRLLILTTWLLLLSGGLWLAVHYTVGEGAGELPHPLEVWCIRVHGAAAFLGMFVLGMLGGSHIPAGWRVTHPRQHRHAHGHDHAHGPALRRSRRTTGLALLGLATVMVGTGYALYYFTPETARPAMGWVHAASGAIMAVMALVHRARRTP